MSDFTALVKNMGDESTSDITILKLSSLSGNEIEKPVNSALIIPGVDGMTGKVWNELSKLIDFPTYILQLLKTANSTSIDELIAIVLQVIYNCNFFNHIFNSCFVF